jgi:hypothetical protein
MLRLAQETVLPDGGEICSAVKRTGWGLYDMTGFPNATAPWDEINKLSATTELLCGHMYFFIPTPEHGESLRDAYAKLMGVGPAMQIVNPDNPRWESLAVSNSYRIAVFSRLVVDEEFLLLINPENSGAPDDFVAIRLQDAVKTFIELYGIIQSIARWRRGVYKRVSDFPLLLA